VVTSHNVILLASGYIERHISMGLLPLNIYHRVPGYPTNYRIGYLGNKLLGCSSPMEVTSTHSNLWSWCDLCVVGQHGILCEVKWWRFVALFK